MTVGEMVKVPDDGSAGVRSAADKAALARGCPLTLAWSWEEALRQALSQGYYIGCATAAELQTGLPARYHRSPTADVLRPRKTQEGRRGTFSAMHGLNEFPWHTDGAIADDPPRFVLLHSPKASSTPTELLRITSDSSYLQALRRAVLYVRYGRPRYLRAVERVAGTTRVRWDPDKLSVASPQIAGLPDASTAPDAKIDWRTDSVALIDNWQCLHRRPKVHKNDSDRVLTRSYVHERVRDV